MIHKEKRGRNYNSNELKDKKYKVDTKVPTQRLTPKGLLKTCSAYASSLPNHL